MPSSKPTQAQRRVLLFFAAFHGDMGYYPNNRETGRFFGWRGVNAMQEHCVWMQRKGLVERVGKRLQARGWALTEQGWLEALGAEGPRVDFNPGHAVIQPAKCDCGAETFRIDGMCGTCAPIDRRYLPGKAANG